jgi:hypothetical protein
VTFGTLYKGAGAGGNAICAIIVHVISVAKRPSEIEPIAAGFCRMPNLDSMLI